MSKFAYISYAQEDREKVDPIIKKLSKDLLGDIYEGDFVDGIREGKGKFTSHNGNVYIGDFTDGLPNGKRIFINMDIFAFISCSLG